MTSTIKTIVLTTVLLGAVVVSGAAGFVYSGSYNVGADEPHSALAYSALETMRDRSIRAHATGLMLPSDLGDQTRIVQGAGNYAAMCAGCHLAPGVNSSELSAGLYPAPPNLTRTSTDAAEAFWMIKHGIKASGMPAWGKSMDDESIWNLAAFLKVLPTLDDAAYDQMVDSSGGHMHGGGAGNHHDAGGGHDDSGGHSEGHGNEHGMAADAGGDSSDMHGTKHDEAAPHAHGAAPHMEMPASGPAASVAAPMQAAEAPASATTPTPAKPAHGHDPTDGHHHAPKK